MAVMQAMVFERSGTPLVPRTLPVPQPVAGEVLVEVHACGVCRTDLHVVDGELPRPKQPLIPGHEIVGTVVAHGGGVHTARRSARGSASPGSARPADTVRIA